MDLLGALAKESRNEEPAHPAIAIRAVGGEPAAVLLAWLHPPQGQGTEPFGPLGAEHPQQSVEMSDASASQQIDDIVRRTAGWRGERLSQLRALIRGADPGVIEEVKWEEALPPRGGARLVPRRHRLHRRGPQERGEADVSKGWPAEGSEGAVQHASGQQDGTCHRFP